ncbi:MAG: multidrug transporter [Pseudomonadota bacterium]|jgi:hypothetical protein|nr:multidrug transporter [Pseudomonadota bacterium]
MKLRNWFAKTFAVLFLCTQLQQPLLAAEEFHASRPSAAAMTLDLVIARPLLIGATVLGSAIFLVSLPFSALGGNVGEAADALVAAPAKNAFLRCLGCTTAD